MKRIEKRYNENFHGATLYLDDIEEICECVKVRYGSEKGEPKIVVNEYRLDNVRELRNDKFHEIESMCISLGDFMLNVYETGQISIWAEGDESLALFIKIKELLKKRNSYLTAITRKYFPYLTILLACAFLFAIIDKTRAFIVSTVAKDYRLILVFSVFVVLIGAFGSVGYFIDKKLISRPKVYNVTMKNRPGFLKRNRDALIVGIIISLVTLIFTPMFK